MVDYVRLPLEGTRNARDLGGYPVDGGVTKFHVFVRSSRLTDLTEKDNELLKEYGITDIIDLRGNTKIQDTFVSDDNVDKEYFNHHYIPLANKGMEEYATENVDKDTFNFGLGYIHVLENKDKIKAIFNILANAKGGVLFHCTAGKDRTGIVASLILGLCGVDVDDIVANYEVTNTYVKSTTFMGAYHPNMQKSPPLFINTFLQSLFEQYETFENFLLACDISQEDLNKIKEKLILKI